LNRWPSNLRRMAHRAMAWALATLFLCSTGFAQDLEPRRWSQLPIGQNFASLTYAHTNGDINVDPTIGIEDATMNVDTALASYIRSFKLANRSARIEVRQAWHNGHWDGTVNGVPTKIERNGISDTIVRVAINLVGPPPLSGKEYGAYRAAHESETIVGAGIAVHLPTGEYFEDKLINLGNNRFTFRPQLGIQHRHRNWTFEATAMAWIYTDNDEFFGGRRLEQDNFYTLDGTAIYSFNSGIWASASAGIGVGGRSRIDGIVNDDRRKDVGWAIAGGFPISRMLGARVRYFDSDRHNFIGNNSQTFSIGLSASWQ
jgi:hypothetical protein